MRRLLIITGVVAALILLFFFAFAGADPQTFYFAQTALVLFMVIVIIVMVSSIVTFLYITVFGRLGRGFTESRLHRFIGWKLLRSQRQGPTVGSSVYASVFEARARPIRTKLLLMAAGAGCLALAGALTSPSQHNAVGHAASPLFATALMWVAMVVGALFFVVGSLGVIAPVAMGAPRPIPYLKQRSAVTLPTFISIVGVAIGIWALIVVLGVMHGLQSDLRDKIMRTNAHVTIEPKLPHGAVTDPLALEHALRNIEGLSEAHAFIHGEVMVSSPTNIAVNVVIKGMDEAAIEGSEQLKGSIIEGGVEWIRRPEALIPDRYRYPIALSGSLSPSGQRDGDGDGDGGARPFQRQLGSRLPMKVPLMPGILIGAELASSLRVDVGGEIQLISPDGDVGPTGLLPKLRSFRIAGIFRTGMYEYDQKLAYVALDDAQRFFNYGRDLNRIEARLRDVELAEPVMAQIDALLSGDPGWSALKASDWRQRNKSLFSALELEKVVMFIILGFIIFVASLLIVSSLVMLVVEKVKEIAVLKALGASDRSIVSAFNFIGSFIGIFGVLAGVPLGVATCLVLMSQNLAVGRGWFYLPSLPVKLDAVELIMVGLAALAMCLLATLYPSRRAARLSTSEGLRHG